MQFGNRELGVRHMFQHGVAIDSCHGAADEWHPLNVSNHVYASDLQEVDIEKAGRHDAACPSDEQLYAFSVWQQLFGGIVNDRRGWTKNAVQRCGTAFVSVGKVCFG